MQRQPRSHVRFPGSAAVLGRAQQRLLQLHEWWFEILCHRVTSAVAPFPRVTYENPWKGMGQPGHRPIGSARASRPRSHRASSPKALTCRFPSF